MARRYRARFVALTARLTDHADVTDPIEAIEAIGQIQVDGRIITNKRAQIRADAAIRVGATHAASWRTQARHRPRCLGDPPGRTRRR